MSSFSIPIGRQIEIQNKIRKQNRKCNYKISRFLKSKLNQFSKKNSNTNPVDDFIKNHKQTDSVTNTLHNTVNINSLDVRRKIFVSLIGLYHSWKKCPSFILYSAIFILPLKKEWIYNPSKPNQSGFNIEIAKKCFSSGEFIELLKWKDSQGLLFCMFDEFACNDNNYLISPFWCHLSEKLRNLYDPITGQNYKAINLDTNWWQNKAKYKTKYDVKASAILAEFYFLTMKYKTMEEILFQSNPKSLHPIRSYKNNYCDNSTPFNSYKLYKFDGETDSQSDDGDNLWISEEYDPYDLN